MPLILWAGLAFKKFNLGIGTMTKSAVTPTDREETFGEEEIIVSKTDLKGRITYANDVFCRVAKFTEKETIGQPHSLVRHPDMPRCVFKLLWDRIEAGQEIFAYVKNMNKVGDYYWVFAHVTPSFDANGEVIGYHSNRRCPTPEAIAAITPVYKALLDEENKHEDRKAGLAAGGALLGAVLEEKGIDYDQFIFSL